MILDTNALSAVADNDPAAVRIFSQAASIELPVIVLGEYRFGIVHSRRRNQYENWLGELIAATRVLPFDDESSVRYARSTPTQKSRPAHPLKRSLDRSSLPPTPAPAHEPGQAL